MARRSKSRVLNLWMNGDFVGTWDARAQVGEELRYAKNWIDSPQGRPLSLSLPINPGNTPLRGSVVRSYFDNLLPDSREIRERLARRFQTGSTDAFDLLAQVGRDCVGALQILSPAAVPTDVHAIRATPLSESEVAQILRDEVSPPDADAAGAHNDDFRISIAGAQEKTALLYRDGQWCRPHGATPTSHIFKLPVGLVGNMKLDLQESVENEWLCLEILAAYGLPVANRQILQFEDIKVLSVERFDRRWAVECDTRWLIRLPQEDFCQATGTPPHLKYEADGGPGVERIMALLQMSQQAEIDKRIFFKAQILFWMLCATDGHAKNFSLQLRQRGAYALTPIYDVLSALPFLGEGPGKLSPFRAKMAMAVRSKNPHWRMRDIYRRHWVAVGQRHGITTGDGRSAGHLIDELIAQTPDVIDKVLTKLPTGFPPSVCESILHGLQNAADKLSLSAQ